MRIAFISYEYPPDAAYGGIATYVHQAARMLANRGHSVEVFASSPVHSGVADEGGVVVHRVRESSHARFPHAIAPVFAARHEQAGFDVLEGPEYGADAADAVRRVPGIPLVVKLHTPSYLLSSATYDGLGFSDSLRWRLLRGRIREYLGRTVRGDHPVWRFTHKYALDAERAHALDADEIVSPSQALAAILTEAWRLDPAKVTHVPYPYVPSEALLDISADGGAGSVLYLGRLEVRKGVLDLARAIPMVLEEKPEVTFRLVGPDDESPRRDVGMREYLGQKLRDYGTSVEFLPPVANDRLAELFATSAIIVIPSVWENFANVCLESMAAARAIIASEAGGMAEMLNHGTAGRLLPPCNPGELAKAIIELLSDPGLRRRLGTRARKRLLDEYNTDRICKKQEQSYQRAIQRRAVAGNRAL